MPVATAIAVWFAINELLIDKQRRYASAAGRVTEYVKAGRISFELIDKQALKLSLKPVRNPALGLLFAVDHVTINTEAMECLVNVVSQSTSNDLAITTIAANH